MSVIGAILLSIVGVAGVMASGNAARPVGDPTRRYSSSWLPSLVVSEVAPFLLVVHALVLTAGLVLGGADNPVGRVGAGLVVVSMLLLVRVVARSLNGVRRLRPLVDGVIHPARGPARLFGLPVPTPPDVVEQHGITWPRGGHEDEGDVEGQGKGGDEGLTLDLIRPADAAPADARSTVPADARSTVPAPFPAGSPAGGPVRLPVCVYVHGGGWTGGGPQIQGRDLYHALALHGWATVAIRYPLAPGASVEEQVAAVLAAVRWTRTGLTDHGIEAGAVILAGGSAGAHLAALAALTASDERERVDAFVGLYGVYDMTNRNRTRAPWPKVASQVMQATVEEAPERYRALSPLDRIHDATPPVLVVHGTHDTLVPVAEGAQFAAALSAAGRPVEFVAVHGAQHSFDAFSSITSRTVAAVIRDWLQRTVAAAEIRPGRTTTPPPDPEF